MNSSTRCFLLLLTQVLFFGSIADAVPIPFGDSSKYWPGWNYGNTGYGYRDDNLDAIGSPNFKGGTVEVDERGFLKKITILQNSENEPSYGALSPGDLFINSNASLKQSWDYIVDLTNWTVAGANNIDPKADFYSIYSIVASLGDKKNYILSGSDNAGTWSGYVIRDGHPVAWGGDRTDTGIDSYFSGWHDDYHEAWTFIFPDEGIHLGSQFAIAWQPNCGNDVIYEKLSTPVPEPATLLLFGIGLVSLASLYRNKLRKNFLIS